MSIRPHFTKQIVEQAIFGNYDLRTRLFAIPVDGSFTCEIDGKTESFESGYVVVDSDGNPHGIEKALFEAIVDTDPPKKFKGKKK